jgi:predicted PurR-regulated permease PerM
VNLRQKILTLLAVLLLALSPLLWMVARPFLAPALLACVVAIAVHPLHERLLKRTRRAWLAALVVTLVTVLVISGLLAMIVTGLTQEIAHAYTLLSRSAEADGGWAGAFSHAMDRMLEVVGDRIPIEKESLRKSTHETMQRGAGWLLKSAGGALGTLTSGVAVFLMATVFLYFLLKYGKRWIEQVAGLAPEFEATARRLLATVNDAVIANVNGVLAVALGQGMLLSIGFWMSGIRSPLLAGAMGGVASIIPLVGPVIVWVPIVIGLALTGAIGKAVLLGLWCALIAGSADNVIRPLVVGGRSQQHPVLIALAMIGGTQAFGALGVLMGPVILSLAIAVVAEFPRAGEDARK